MQNKGKNQQNLMSLYLTTMLDWVMNVVVNALIFELDYVDKSIIFSCTPKEVQNPELFLFLP